MLIAGFRWYGVVERADHVTLLAGRAGASRPRWSAWASSLWGIGWKMGFELAEIR